VEKKYRYPQLIVGDLVHFCMDASIGIIIRSASIVDIQQHTSKNHRNYLLYYVLWADGVSTPHHDFLLRKVK